MSSKSFSYRGVLGFGWDVMRYNFWFFVGVGIVLILILLPEQILGRIMERSPQALAPFWFFTMSAVIFIIQVILGIGLIKIALSFCDGQRPAFNTLFSGFDCFWRYIGTGLLYGLIVGGISSICILPLILLSSVMQSPCLVLPIFITISILAIILSIKFSLSFYFVIDKGLGPIKALKASSRTTGGAKWSLFVFGILCGLINLVGMLCFIVGLFVTAPMIMVAMALAYRQLSEQTPELAEFGIGAAKEIQPVASSQPSLGVRLSQGIQPAPSIHEAAKKGSSTLLWWVAAGVCVVIMAGIGYYFLARVKGEDVVTPKTVVVTFKEAVSSSKEVSLKGILYSEDNASALIGDKIAREGDIIDGVKVVKINKDSVEFEKNGARWTQRIK